MNRIGRWTDRQRESLGLAVHALRTWRAEQVTTAVVASVAVAVVVGMATALIPNPIFGREIPPVAWNYPVWIVTSVLTGILIATYVRTVGVVADETERRSARLGGIGGVLAWFAVGCPVCNKIALVALGYSGALTWFAPVQPVLAGAALLLSSLAVVWRLRGQVACSTPARPAVPAG